MKQRLERFMRFVINGMILKICEFFGHFCATMLFVISETRIDEVADQLIDLKEVLVVSDNAARCIAGSVPLLPKQVKPQLLRKVIDDLGTSGKIDIVDLDGGEIALE